MLLSYLKSIWRLMQCCKLFAVLGITLVMLLAVRSLFDHSLRLDGVELRTEQTAWAALLKRSFQANNQSNAMLGCPSSPSSTYSTTCDRCPARSDSSASGLSVKPIILVVET